MTEEMCPFHHVVDQCLNTARMLADAGFLTPSANAPAMRGIELPAMPTLEATLAFIADRINTWGSPALDPSIPPVNPDDERSVRYSLQALHEVLVAKRDVGSAYMAWAQIRHAVDEAHWAAGRTQFETHDSALNWYVALRYLDGARTVWTEAIAPTLTGQGSAG